MDSAGAQPSISACCVAKTDCCQGRGSPHEQRTRLRTTVLIRPNSLPTIVTTVPPSTGPPVGYAA